MKLLSGWIVSHIATPLGVFVLAALDSTLFVSLPAGIDVAVIMLAARAGAFWWVVPLLASFGSLVGAALTFWMGIKVGEHGLERYVAARHLRRARTILGDAGAVRLAVLDLLPPPFPFTPFIMAAGALKVNVSTFFATLAACRLLRFGLEALLAVLYGRRILSAIQSDAFYYIVVAFSVIAVGLTIASIAKLLSGSRHGRRATAASEA